MPDNSRFSRTIRKLLGVSLVVGEGVFFDDTLLGRVGFLPDLAHLRGRKIEDPRIAGGPVDLRVLARLPLCPRRRVLPRQVVPFTGGGIVDGDVSLGLLIVAPPSN